MIKIDETIAYTAKKIGISQEDMKNFIVRGEQHTYAAEEWLFHESTPRQWAGFVVDGDVEILRGLHGAAKRNGWR